METRDLQVGDWVEIWSYKDENTKWYAKVLGLFEDQMEFLQIEHDGTNGSIGTRPVKDCRPLEINDEFLCRCGFSFHDDYGEHSMIIWWKRAFDNYNRFVTVKHMDLGYGWFWQVHIDDQDCDSIGSVCVENVHQLQQFMRICGVKEELEKI